MNLRRDDVIVCKKAECIGAITDFFCSTYVQMEDEELAQRMNQAATDVYNSVKEGMSTETPSPDAKVNLITDAKASIQELLEAYKDYLTTHNLAQWGKDDPRHEHTRDVCRRNNEVSYYTDLMPRCSSEVIVNIVITLICQEDLMLRNIMDHYRQEGQRPMMRDDMMYGGRMPMGGAMYRQSNDMSYLRDQMRPYMGMSDAQRAQEEIRLRQLELMLDERERQLKIREDELARLISIAKQMNAEDSQH